MNVHSLCGFFEVKLRINKQTKNNKHSGKSVKSLESRTRGVRTAPQWRGPETTEDSARARRVGVEWRGSNR